jgi:hypothetical protein
MSVTVVTVPTLERPVSHGEHQGAGPPGSGLGPALQPAGRDDPVHERSLPRVGNESLVLTHSLASEAFMQNEHGDVS